MPHTHSSKNKANAHTTLDFRVWLEARCYFISCLISWLSLSSFTFKERKTFEFVYEFSYFCSARSAEFGCREPFDSAVQQHNNCEIIKSRSPVSGCSHHNVILDGPRDGKEPFHGEHHCRVRRKHGRDVL